MQIIINGRIEDMANAAIRSGRFRSVEEFVEAMANHWQADQLALNPLPDRIDIEALAAGQGVKPFEAIPVQPENIWPLDESTDDFLSFLRQERDESSRTHH